MTNFQIQQHKFIVKAGMTIDDVKNSKLATAMQKKYVSAFDVDNNKKFSQDEANIFNATTFSEKTNGSVMFWTRQQNGTKKGTKFNSKDADKIKYEIKEEVKPYIKTVAVKNQTSDKTQTQNKTKNSDGLVAGLVRNAGFSGLADFLRSDWSGEMVRKIGLNGMADWLEDKDKVCTDGKDDGNLSTGETALSLAKGLIGGIPKTMINHPVKTALAIGAGAAAGGPALLLMCASGIIIGTGVAIYGAVKASDAKTDGEKKLALETLGTGISTTVISVASVDNVLEQAYEAGVQTAHVVEDADFVTKTVQLFKAIPESFKLSLENLNFKYGIFSSSIKDAQGNVTQKNYTSGAYRKYDRGEFGTEPKVLIEERTPGGIVRTYQRTENIGSDNSMLLSEQFPNGTIKSYDMKYGFWKNQSILKEESHADGSYVKLGENGNVKERFSTEQTSDFQEKTSSWFENTKLKKPEKYVKKSLKLSSKQITKKAPQSATNTQIQAHHKTSKTHRKVD